MKKDITIIIGPTGIGKSDFAIETAKKIGGQIISADAYQVYKGMDIGTAKVTAKQLKEVPHHLIDVQPPNIPFYVTDFMSQSEKIIQSLRKQNVPIIICGGTGLYIRSFLYNFEFLEQDKSEPDYKKSLELRLQDEGIEPLFKELSTIDPDMAEITGPHNARRILRALEIHHVTSEKPSELRKKAPAQRDDVQIIGLKAERDHVIDRIHCRVDKMIKMGLIDEVKQLVSRYEPSCLAFQALGYKQTINYLKGSLSKEEMIDLIKTKTRQFSKRQMTWFRQLNYVDWKTVTN